MNLKTLISLIVAYLSFFSFGQDKNFSQANLDSLFAISRKHLIDKNYREADIILEELIRRESELDPEKIPVIHNNIGVAKYGLGNYSEGIKHYKIALKEYQSVKNDTLSAQAYLNLGLAYKEIGADSLASTMIYQAIYTFRQLGLEQDEISALSSLGNLYRDGQQFNRSEYYLNTSLTLSKKSNYHKGVAYALHGLGTLMMEKGAYSKAEDYFQRSLFIKDSLKLFKHAATTCAKLGELYLLLDDCKKAKIYLNKSIFLRSEEGLSNDLKAAMNYFHLGQLEQKCGTIAISEEYYLKAERIFQQQSASKDLSRTYEALLEIYKLQGRSKDALEISTKLIDLKEIILGENNQKEIAKLAIEYDVIGHKNAVKLKEVENKHLSFRNTLISAISVGLFIFLIVIFILFRKNVLKKKQIESQNEMLNAKNSDIITLHDELSHRTNNFFSLLQGMLRIDSENSLVEKNELLSLYGARIQAMADVQQHLVLGKNKSIMSVNFKAYLKDFIENSEILYAQRNLTSIKHNIHTLKIENTKYEIPTRLGIILNELINNSVKHNADTKEGVSISIDFQYANNQLKIQFTDNGSLDQSKLPSDGSGLLLIEELLQPIRGSVVYTRVNSFEALLIIPIS